MTIAARYVSRLTWFLSLSACGESLPDDIQGYAERCIRMNQGSIAERDSDPHSGEKNVYACNVDVTLLEENARPFPEDTVIVKDSRKMQSDYVWLIAVAKKREGSWSWAEYTRNFEHETFIEILAPESVCTDCHRDARTIDWIFTQYERP